MQSDDLSFTSGKLRKFVLGEVNDNEYLHDHTALVGQEESELLSFLQNNYALEEDDDLPANFTDTEVHDHFVSTTSTKHMGEAVQAGNSSLMSYAVGLTDSEVGIESTHAFAKMARSVLNEKAPYIGLMFGRMNYGKTNFALLYIELWKELVEMKYDTSEYAVVSNMASLQTADHVVTDLDEFRRVVVGDEEYWDSDRQSGTPPVIPHEKPVFWLFDECSTHLDARRCSYEVTQHYTPLVKRFAKMNVDAMHIGHSGMDVHADLRRSTISTEFIFKTGLESADVFESMDEDAGADLKYELEDIPESTISYDPDDFSPWSWP